MDANATHRLCVAPMMDWTDRHCRVFHRLLAPHARLYTEMVHAHAVPRSMSVQNLVRVVSPVELAPDPAEVGRGLDATNRRLADAAHGDLSSESRFDLAYEAVR